MRSRSVVAVVGLGCVLGLAGAVPASAAAPLPPTQRMSAQQIERVGDKYLRIVCPTNMQGDQAARAWERAFGDVDTMPDGTPLPKYLRTSFAKMNDAYTREIRLFKTSRWPRDLTAKINRLAAIDAKRQKFYASRDTAVVEPTWVKQFPPGGRKIAASIRKALELPPPGRNAC